MIKNKARKITAYLLAAILVTGLSACSGNNGRESTVPELLEPVGAKLETAVVERGTVSITSVYDGSVIPETMELSFDVDGRIKKVNSFIGREVKAGDVIIEIESVHQEQIESLEEELDNLKAAREHEEKILNWEQELAELELRRLESAGASSFERENQALVVSERKLAIKQARERYDLRLTQIERKLTDLRVDPERLQLVSPIDARISYLPAFAEGDSIRAYDTVTVLADENSLLVRSGFVSDYSLSSAVSVTALINGEDVPLIPHELDWETYMTLVLNDKTPYTYYSIKDLDKGSIPAGLEAGLYVPVTVTGEAAVDTLRIPRNCIYRDGQQRYVYLIVDNERVRQDVEVGLSNATWIEIKAGLEEGERVYIHD